MFYFSICFISFVALFILGVFLFLVGFYFVFNDLVIFIEWDVITLNSSSVVMTFLFDWMSLVFTGFVFFISSLVILYSDDYMHGDVNINRFILLVLMFVLSMMFLIISPNMISILLGWDGLGLVSYCLVIYYQNVKSYNAGMLTVLSNRIGDVALLMVIAWMINFGSWNYIYYLDFLANSFEMGLISLLVILAAMTSSAQIPFSSWLPAAMAAPTPVSALVHSSTLVTAGVYLLIRFSPVINGWLCTFLLLFSGLTMFMAGLGANLEYDLSKIIALSTLSQLGLMIGAVSVGFAGLAFFHLLTHALFSALLFMCAGVIIHTMKDSQDIRFMGGLSFQMPYTSVCLGVSSFALCGMPFLAGFYSSDFILEMVSFSYMNLIGFILFFASTGLTVCYSFRLFYYVFCGDFNLSSFYFISESNVNMLYGMLGLMAVAVLGGSMLSWVIFYTPSMICLPFYLSFLTIFVCLLGGWVGYELSMMNLGGSLVSLLFYNTSSFSGSMWFMPYFSTYGVSLSPLLLGYDSLSISDLGWAERLGGQGVFWFLMYMSSVNQWWQYNSLSMFLMFFVMWFVVLMFMFV
uniref:NADH-ubiquinone oxidoreductase chain 5 n=1 Tax=Glyptotermes sp. 6 AB-2022a TaxID=2942729 RepID=A0A8X8M3W5_9NEOP|nr:NADH dehydrogenase subunit 5 [Glyptotermes sp. 6 AB-2022a]URX52975.1 NADH dehydrogenase subunit 5 [Glyptotermes sp. 6 AB-2022a]URX54520.1 NADH dehydrogenase subunit 5 [Glyptotermes sp. 6 AB-2022a]